jgi:hypothetical protein
MTKARHSLPQIVRTNRRLRNLLSVRIFTKWELNMTTTHWSKAILFASVLALALPGCGESVPPPPKEDLVPVTGTVKVGGQPVAGLILLYIPKGTTTGNGSFAVTGADGKYELLHNQTQKPGAQSGTYTVRFSRFLKADGSPVPLGESPYMANAMESIPSAWNEPGQAGAHNTVTVPAGGTTLDFDIPLR